jgi:hypothetical protein
MNRVRYSARRAVASVGLLLAACSSAPPVEWQANAKAALDRAVAAYLAGDTRVANTEFALARRELASTGRADQVALAELTRCGVQVASLDIGPCEGFERLRADATPQERAYADYLANRMRPGDSALLPEPQRMFAAGGLSGDAATATLKNIDDPLGRWLRPACFSRAAARIPPPSRSLPTPHRRKDGGGRCLHGWGCNSRSPKRPGMPSASIS